MPSPFSLDRFFRQMSWLCFLTNLFVWRDPAAAVLLCGLGFVCALVHYAMGRYYPEVKVYPLPLLPRLHLAARFRLLRRVQVPHLARVALFGAVATLVFFRLPWLLRHTIMPTAGGFTPDNIGGAALGAFQFFAALSIAYVSWRYLFPGLYAYAVETMGSKLLESITTDLSTRLEDPYAASHELEKAAERRKIATLTFTIRCVRFAFSVSPFVFFFVQANHALASALTVVPPAALGL